MIWIEKQRGGGGGGGGIDLREVENKEYILFEWF